MAITNYAEVQTAVASWLNRSDLTAIIPDFITLAEARLKRDERVRDHANSGASITALSGGSNWLIAAHPDIYLYATLCESAPYLHDDPRIAVWEGELEKRLADLETSRLNMSRTPSLANYAGLQAMIAEYLDRPDLGLMTATFITLAEASLKRDLAGAATFTALSGGANWLFTTHPDVYLYAALCEAAPWLKKDDEPRLATWKAARDERVAEVLRMRDATAYDLTTYSGLQAAIKGWLDRRDLDASVTTFITLAEAKLKRELAGGTTIVSLSGAAPSNWLLTSHPDVYLYGALMEAAPYLKDDPRLETWRAMLLERVEEVRRSRTATAYDLTTYAGLQTAVKGWLDRYDVDAVALITLAEKSLARDPRLKKLKSATFVVDADDETVPTDFHVLQSWYHDSSAVRGPIEIVSADALSRLKSERGGSGAPAYAAIIDGKFRFAPVADGSYTTKITYWKTLGSVAAATSWLFTESPDIYLYAALVAAEPYVKNDPRLATWKTLLDEQIENVRQETGEYHYSGTLKRRFSRAIG